MQNATCSVDDCERAVFSRAWCQMHYTRWLRHGDPLHPDERRRGPAYDRIMARTVPVGDCLEFTGVRNGSGYGMVRDGRMRSAARVVIEHHRGPSELHVLHSCDNRACVEIAHLRYGTHRENIADRQARNPSYPIGNQWGRGWARLR